MRSELAAAVAELLEREGLGGPLERARTDRVVTRTVAELVDGAVALRAVELEKALERVGGGPHRLAG